MKDKTLEMFQFPSERKTEESEALKLMFYRATAAHRNVIFLKCTLEAQNAENHYTEQYFVNYVKRIRTFSCIHRTKDTMSDKTDYQNFKKGNTSHVL